MGQKRAILAEVLTVTVKPTTSGRYFDSDAVDVELTYRARSVIR
ncbi:MAG TPA: hypothetical protein VEF72_23280 [Mycobacterium sp.]|nr:hypothetical protein [Mycobacterium sp.]